MLSHRHTFSEHKTVILVLDLASLKTTRSSQPPSDRPAQQGISRKGMERGAPDLKLIFPFGPSAPRFINLPPRL